MAKLNLVVIKANHQSFIPSSQGNTTIVYTEQGTQYQLKNTQGNTPRKSVQKKVNNDLWIFDEDNLSSEPDFILQDYYLHNLHELMPFSETAATEIVTEAVINETTISTQTVTNKTLASSIMLAPVAFGGVAALIHSNKDNHDNSSAISVTPPTPTPTPTPISATVTIDNIATTINQEAAKGYVLVTGTVATSGNVTSTNVVVTVNGKEYNANISGQTWSVNILGTDLAYAQGTNNITATVTAKDNHNQTTTNTATNTYFVDTVIEKPVITFNQITGDNIINSLEAKQTTTKITGTAKNVNDGDIIILTIGTTQYSVAIQNGEFSVDVDTLTLVTHKTVNASISTKDSADNHATTTLSQDVTIDNTAATKPNITINNVTPDNIVNATEASGNITVTGTSNAEAGTNIIVRCTCTACSGTKVVDLPTRIKDDGSFEVTFQGTDIQNADTITVITEANTDKNIDASETSKTYTVDTKAPEATLAIDNVTDDNTINANEAKNTTITLKGTLGNLGADESIQSVNIVVNGKTHVANITNNSYSVAVNTGDLLLDNTVKVTAIIKDTAGNTQTLNEQKTYSIDTTIPTGSISITSVAEDNVINLSEFGKKVSIVGRVTGQFNVNDTVNIMIDGKAYPTAITNANGDFSLSIDANILKDANTKSVTATLTTTNSMGNSATYTTATDFSYTAETPPLDLNIVLEKISGDNFINVTEAKETVTVTGKVTGNDFDSSQTVDLILNGTVIAKGVTVGTDGKFSTTVSGTALANSQGHTLTAKVTGHDSITHSLNYGLDKNTSAKIDILSVDSDNSIDLAQGTGLAHIEGTVSFTTGTYSTADNLKLVRTADITIGTEVYSVGVRDGKFSLDIPESKLAELNGQTLSYTFKAEPWRFINGKATGYNNEGYLGHDDDYQTNSPYFVAKSPTVTLNSPHIIKSGGQDIVQTQTATSTVSGTVSGVAKVGDEISIELNGHIYHTQVLSGNRFEVKVATSDLNAHANSYISATLHTTDLSGQKISVTDHEAFARADAVSGDFVKTHINTKAANEYFVRDLNIAEIHKVAFGTDVLPVYDIDVGGATTSEPAIIKYYFAKPSDYDSNINNGTILDDDGRKDVIISSITTHPNDVKKIIRAAYDQLESYLNVKFKEVHSLAEADTNHFYADFVGPSSPDSAVALAFAYNSGSLWWNAKASINDINETMYTALHEISHNLNMAHSGTKDGKFLNDPKNFEETPEFTYMSYRANVNNKAFKYLKNLRMYDLAFLHFQLGINKTHNPENDVYTFKEYNMFTDTADRYIWDGGGIDTFDASKEQQGVNVNLTPGSWIYVGNQPTVNFAVANQTVHADNQFIVTKDTHFYAFYDAALTENTYTKGQAFIGYGTQIENLVGSAHDDILTGNDADNIISGGAGNDTITGGLGNDYLDGGLGADKLYGGDGNDTYIVDNTSDTVTELSNQGNEDWIYSSVNYTLPADVENIGLFGAVANEAIGNNLDNTLIANNIGNTLKGMAGNDTLVGSLGADTLDGGLGADTYVFDTNFNGTIDTLIFDAQDKIALDANIFVGLIKDKTDNLDKLIKYNQDTGILSYDQDGSGEIDAIAFAKVEGDFTFSIDKFIVI